MSNFAGDMFLWVLFEGVDLEGQVSFFLLFSRLLPSFGLLERVLALLQLTQRAPYDSVAVLPCIVGGGYLARFRASDASSNRRRAVDGLSGQCFSVKTPF